MTDHHVPPLTEDEQAAYLDCPVSFQNGMRYGRRQLAYEQAQRATARRTDPDTSHAAAASIGDLPERHRFVWKTLQERGPATDEQLVGRYALSFPNNRQTPSSIRTRRHELVTMGLVRDTGERRQISTGRKAIVWSAVPETA